MKSSGIGGQAVLEGVMMRNKSKYAVAVRKPDGEISVKADNYGGAEERSLFLRLPIIRGIVAFVDSLVLGMRTLTYSSSFYEDEQDNKKEDAKGSSDTLVNVLIVLASVVIAVAVFMLLPFLLAELLRKRVPSQTTLVVIEGCIRVILFVAYVIAISFMKDIKRVFMYHGAEHKTINCVENGLELTVENVKTQSTHHRRCGTSFLLFVMLLSVVFFIFIQIDNVGLRMVFRVLLVPVIAGVAYEFIRLAGNSDNPVIIALSKPGMLLQLLTTREPDDDMIEVAIASVEAVFDWKTYQRRMQAALGKKKSGKNTESKKKSRAEIKKELAAREEEYRKRAKERALAVKAQEEREKALEQQYSQLKEKMSTKPAANAVKLTSDDDELDGLDHFFDRSIGNQESKKSVDSPDK